MPALNGLDPFLVAATAVFALSLAAAAVLYFLGGSLFGWNAFRVRVTRRFSLAAALLAIAGLIASVLGQYTWLGESGPVIVYIVLVAFFAFLGYGAYFFYRVFPQRAARWQAEETRRQYMPRPKGHAVSRPSGGRKKAKKRR